MKKISVLLMLCTFAFSCKDKKDDTSASGENDKTAEHITASNESEWIILFDGSSMDAWRGYAKDTMGNGWSIEDGNLTYTPGQPGPNDIITKEKFTDFELSLEWKISEGGNSGIFWSVLEEEGKPIYVSAPEIQVLDNERHPDAKNGTSHQAGALYDLISPYTEAVKPAGEWNLCLLKINHETNVGVSFLNDKEVASFPLHGEVWNKMIADSKFKDWKTFGTAHTGHIGLQDHGDKVFFRNIKIKPLN